jgi:F0F1-type ATP synthase assembly protein I
LAVVLAAAVVVPLVLGVVIDNALRSGPIFVLIGLCLGVIAAVAVGYTRFKRFL